MSYSQQDLELSQKIVADYGRLLSSMQPSFYGLPLSKLPYTITEIKDAIYAVLNAINHEEKMIIDSLKNAYVYLGQFIPDDEIITVDQAMGSLKNTNNAAADTKDIEQAGFITSKIKLRMENNLEEIQLIISGKTTFTS